MLVRAPSMLAGRAVSTAVSPGPSTILSTHPHNGEHSSISPLYNMETAVLRKAVLSDPKLFPESSVATPALGGETEM